MFSERVQVITERVLVKAIACTGASPPPGGTEKSNEARWIDIHEDDAFDEAQMASWLAQAAALPGWIPWQTLAS